jgi:putative glutamine amidotransferase
VRDRESWPPTHGHRHSYIRAIIQAGGLPLLIPVVEQEELIQTYYTHLDGLLLAGGKDITPDHYGEAPHEKLDTTDPTQDDLELALTRRALADQMPILAICRGIQMLNVAHGGTLYQDIGAQYTTSIDHRISLHHARENRRDDWSFPGHELQLEPDSLLAHLLATEHLHINSLHHQAIKHLGEGLRAVGHAPDGITEAVEGICEAFVVGVQCHPEALYAGSNPRWPALFTAFVAQCQAFQARRASLPQPA